MKIQESKDTKSNSCSSWSLETENRLNLIIPTYESKRASTVGF